MKKLNRWYIYVCCFFVFCFVGWLYEVVWEFKVGNGFVNRGFLHGCYLPVYGFGGIILLLCLEKLIKTKIKIWKVNVTPVIVFLAILFIVSAIELLTSYAMELIWGVRMWDYSYDKFNLDGRISLRNSALLAIGGMFYLYILYPVLDKIFSKIKPVIMKISAAIIVVVMMVDFIMVLVN